MKLFCRNFFSCLLVLLPAFSFAQLSDNFADGDFTNSPAWVGDTVAFDINTNMLHSNGPQASSVIYLSTANTLIDSAEWNFLLRLDFNPSSTNQVRIFLVSDQQDLSGNLNGYFVQFGESGTAPDSLDIFKQTGSTVTKIFTGVSGIMTSTTTNSVRIRVVRHTGGAWDVYADKTGGTNFIAEGSFIDNSIATTNYFGVVADYATASRYNLYFFDDFSIGNIISDTIRPTVASVNVLSSTTIDVKFSEPVSAITAQTLANYSVNNSIGNPAIATRDGSDFSLVHLTFSNALVNGTNYLLNISGVKDLSANTMNTYSFPFAFYNAGAYDILINEIFADPDPQVGLPLVEFVELYNKTAFPITLTGWKFSDASTTVTLSYGTILPDSFIILCANANVDSFLNFGLNFNQIIGLSSLPSLNNTGDNLTLKDNFGNTIHNVNYIDNWYNNSTKRNGGWSLELINPQNPCQNNNNWTGSNDISGGTPGRRNSVYNTSTTSQFSLTGADVLSPTEIVLQFSQNIDKTSAEMENNFTVNNGVANPVTALLDSFDFSKVHLVFSSPLDSNLIYTVTVAITNCAGINISSQNSYQFAIPHSANKFDVLINEIFPDPEPQVGLPAAEYIELYNRSNKAINLKNWELSKAGVTGATLANYLLLPDSFIIVTSSTTGINFAAFSNVMPVSSFPALTNTGDQLLLKDNNATLIHYLSYDDTWYHDDAKKNGGWSLELIDADNPCNGKENWRASLDATGGTPGKKNSVVALNPDTIFPQLVRAALDDNNTLLLYFSEPLNNGNASNISNYVISNGVGSPLLALPIPYNYQTVRLEFGQNFQSGIIYSVRVSNLADCSGNTIGMSDSARFAIPEKAAANDIIINEILFNPKTSGYDFVELYNRSNKVVDLKQLDVLEKDISNPEIILEQASPVTGESYLLFPQEFVVLSQNIENIKQNYFTENTNALLEVSSLPNYDNNQSICLLRNHNGITLDSLAYDHNWHFALLDVEDGVSLERIDYNKPTQDKSNWHSAASTAGFATPTYRNSQFSQTGITDDGIKIEPEVFTPDNDGDKDFTFINYKFTEAGYTLNAKVYDAKGREIRTLARSELLGSEGKLMWDGIDDNNQKARVGIYIVYVEVFNLQGKVKHIKKQVVLGAKLN